MDLHSFASILSACRLGNRARAIAALRDLERTAAYDNARLLAVTYRAAMERVRLLLVATRRLLASIFSDP